MMARWGLDGMRSFEQASVAAKEGDRLQVEQSVGETAASSTASPSSA